LRVAITCSTDDAVDDFALFWCEGLPGNRAALHSAMLFGQFRRNGFAVKSWADAQWFDRRDGRVRRITSETEFGLDGIDARFLHFHPPVPDSNNAGGGEAHSWMKLAKIGRLSYRRARCVDNLIYLL